MTRLVLIVLGVCAISVTASDPMEDPNLFEGDMILTEEQKREHLYGAANYQIPLAATKDNLWPKTIPFSMATEISSDYTAVNAIKAAIADYEKFTCLRFKKRTTEAGYIHFYRGGGCSSPVGYFRRRNRISLARGCWHKGIVIHEIAHSLGFYHEQSRPDRDDHVTIRWENIPDHLEYNFRKQPNSNIDSMKVPYDYESVMHYGKTAFGSGKITIVTKDPAKQNVIGRRSGFSHYDIKQMNLLYECNGGATTQKPVTTKPACSDTYPNDCPRWKNSGYCTDSRYKAFMEKHCKNSCGKCGGKGTTPNPVTTKPACSDTYPNDCPRWKNSGYCTDSRYKDFMERHCKNSCGKCGGKGTTPNPVTTKPACDDVYPNYCPRWKNSGLCTHKDYKDYMERNCKRTCGKCGGVVTTAPATTTAAPTTKACADLRPKYCPAWKNSGFCTDSRYKRYMERNCRKSCGICGGGGSTKAPKPTTSAKTTAPRPTASGNCGKPDIVQSRVIAGVDAKKGAWPWQILMIYNGRTMCGGSLISAKWVVTAAHCVSGRESSASYFRVRVGEHITGTTSDGQHQDIGVEKIISHPQYSRSTIDSDIALMKLSSPVQFGKYVKPVCLPAQGKDVPVGTQCFITGWGKIKHPGSMHHTLQQGKMPVASKTDCTNMNTKNLGIRITDNMVCAGHGGTTRVSGCHGDSGGPFVCQTGANGSWELHGAVSWGSGRCDATQGYTVFARVTKFRSWIDQEVARG